MNEVGLPKNTALANKVIDAQAKERGWMGHFFGTKEHAPNNIAAMALILLIILLALVLFVPVAAGVDRGAITTALLSAVTFTIGLIFGRSGKSD